jgi:hypothetical protein
MNSGAVVSASLKTKPTSNNATRETRVFEKTSSMNMTNQGEKTAEDENNSSVSFVAVKLANHPIDGSTLEELRMTPTRLETKQDEIEKNSIDKGEEKRIEALENDEKNETETQSAKKGMMTKIQSLSRVHTMKHVEDIIKGSTFHRLGAIYEAESLPLKIIIGTCFLACVGYCVYQIITTIIVFISYASLTSISVFYEIPAEFPGISV